MKKRNMFKCFTAMLMAVCLLFASVTPILANDYTEPVMGTLGNEMEYSYSFEDGYILEHVVLKVGSKSAVIEAKTYENDQTYMTILENGMINHIVYKSDYEGLKLYINKNYGVVPFCSGYDYVYLKAESDKVTLSPSDASSLTNVISAIAFIFGGLNAAGVAQVAGGIYGIIAGVKVQTNVGITRTFREVYEKGNPNYFMGWYHVDYELFITPSGSGTTRLSGSYDTTNL